MIFIGGVSISFCSLVCSPTAADRKVRKLRNDVSMVSTYAVARNHAAFNEHRQDLFD